jgi:CRP/FNR family transcriptional regulator, anaerobic regulatory protein
MNGLSIHGIERRNPARPGGQQLKEHCNEAVSPCAACRVRPLNICNVLLKQVSPKKGISKASESDWQLHAREQARRNLKSTGERSGRLGILCDGWAFRFVQLPDGRRQILTILLPGDVITLTRIFDEKIQFSVQAITNVHFCGYDRATLKARLNTDDEFLGAWSNLVIIETRRNFELMVDLGCRSADERIAHLILETKLRLKQRGLVVDSTFKFPLSQKIIAEATGLTPEHVSRVLASFRRTNLIESNEGWLKITNLSGLQRIGDLSV